MDEKKMLTLHQNYFMKELIFDIVAPTTGSFEERLSWMTTAFDERLRAKGWGLEHLVWSRVFLSDAANQLDEVLKHPLYAERLSKGAFSYIEQPPLGGCKIALVVCLSEDELIKSGTPDKCILACHGCRHLYQSVRFSVEEARAMSPKQQTMEAFRRHIAWLREEGLTLKDNCMRTWLFVRDIDRNYHDVVEGRNEIFAKEGLTPDTHFIASTGIGGNGANGQEVVCVDFWSVDDSEMSVTYLKALDHLNPTHEYGVAFERGTSFRSDDVERLIISGTASIDRYGHCINVGNVLKQADRLFENIDHLLADGGATLNDVVSMYVYLRDLSDYDVVKDYMERRFPHVSKVILLAPVCRPQWLIETECMAVKSC